MRRPDLAIDFGHGQHGLQRVFDELFKRDGFVGNPVHEGRVRAVFEQPPYQVGEQRLVRADGGIDSTWPAQAARAGDLLVQRLTHAVQALELVLLRCEVGSGERVDGRHGLGVMGRELGKYRLGRAEQLARASQVREVGVGLACVDRIARLAIDLRALDLAVPVRTFDESHHDPVLAAPRQIDQEIDDRRAALLIRLEHKTDAVPAGQVGLETQPLQQIERQLQPVGFLGVDVEPDVMAPRESRQSKHAWIKLPLHALDLGARVTRVERRQLDRNARPFDEAAPVGSRTNGMNRRLVGGEVVLGIHRRQRRFAQHVVRVPETLRLPRAGIGKRLFDRLAGDELLAHQAHRHVDALANQRLAATPHHLTQRRRQAAVTVCGHQLTRQQQTPRRRIHEQRRTLSQVLLPVAVADLVADQGVARRLVGYPQQRFGQTHQRHALLRTEGELLQQALDQPGFAARAAARTHACGNAQREGLNRVDLLARAPGLLDQPSQQLRFRGARDRTDGLAQRRFVQRGCQRQRTRFSCVDGLRLGTWHQCSPESILSG